MIATRTDATVPSLAPYIDSPRELARQGVGKCAQCNTKVVSDWRRRGIDRAARWACAGCVARRRRLIAGGPVHLVVEDAMDEVPRGQRSDVGEGPEAHQHVAVPVEDNRAPVGT